MSKPPTKKVLDITRPAKKKPTEAVVELKKTSKQSQKKASVSRVKQKEQKEKTPKFITKRKQSIHKHPFIVPVATFLVLFFVSLVGIVAFGGQTVGPTDSHIVQLSIDGDGQTVPTRAKDVKEFLSRAHIDVHEGDVVEPALESEIDSDDFRVNVYRARPVTIIDGTKRVQTLSAAKTPRSVATQAGVTVYPEDEVESSRPTEELLKDKIIGEKVVIDRATPANLNLYGTQVAVRTRANTVGDLLKEKQVNLTEGDTVQPSPETPLAPDTQVFVVRNGTQIASVEEEIKQPEEIVEDASLSFGATAVRQQGSAGKKVVTYQLDLRNGREIGRKVIQEVIVTPPVTKIVARGKAYSVPEDKAALLTAAGIAQSDFPYVDHIISRESGWCATKWQGQIGICPPYYTELHSTSSGYGYGLCQATPAGKMASAGSDWNSNPVTQLKWCSGYATGRYGSWAAAYEFWSRNHWW